jgi:hypothetical protein
MTGALLAAAKLTDSQSIGCAALNQRGDRIVVAKPIRIAKGYRAAFL